MYPDMEDWLRRMGIVYKWGEISKMKKYLILIILIIVTKSVWSDENNLKSRNELLNNSNKLIEKINFLETKGYILSKNIPTSFILDTYNMVYSEVNKIGRIRFGFDEDGINYDVVFALNMPNDPNYFVIAKFSIDNIVYWFFKINFFLEFNTEKEFMIEEDGIWKSTILKTFY